MNIAASFPTSDELHITGEQMRLVYEKLSSGDECTLGDIFCYCKWYGKLYRETSISARIRQLNGILSSRRLEITHRPKIKGSRDQVYRLEAMR